MRPALLAGLLPLCQPLLPSNALAQAAAPSPLERIALATDSPLPDCPNPDLAERQKTDARLLALFAHGEVEDDALAPLDALYRGETGPSADYARIFTEELARDRLATLKRRHAALTRIDRCAVSPEMRISLAAYRTITERQLEALEPDLLALTGVRPFNHTHGLHVEFASIVAPGGNLAYDSEADYRRTLALYRTFPGMIDNAMTRLREGLDAGIVEPRSTISNMIGQIDAILADLEGDTPFLAPLEQFPETISQARRTELRLAYAQAVKTDIAPTYRRLRSFLADDYFPRARREEGLSALPGGARLYRHLIGRETTLDLDAADIHALGLSEVARIRGEMMAVAHELGSDAPLEIFFDQIREDPRFHPSSADQLANGFAEVARKVDEAAPRFFSQRPETPLDIAAYPAFSAPYMPGGSYSEAGSEDGTHGVFLYNTHDLAHRFLSGTTTLYLHEGIPGHHYQISLARENSHLPAFQRYEGNNAFVEGWALYAETLGYDMGLYADPLQHWGTLDDEMLRAMRLVVDTGLHAQGWSRDRAIAYMLANSGMGRLDAISEVDRYIAMPAQALSYKLGAITIQRLRAEAEERLGERFDIRAFHQQVLGSGALPLDVLSHKMHAWIAAEATAVPSRSTPKAKAR
ncbi:DUF885 domain-containing protein [Novosphingobium sp. YJ-S2-02]|uniref:DUF885 domain-containing protein n=1 Tax=Novosphingobium aureum TaxID=2792964 RepID=A0A931ML11_9SPHN|nr:DUF885 domain-containing protein [Novosphingobium aureum]